MPNNMNEDPDVTETMKTQTAHNEAFDPAAMQAEAERMIQEGTMPSLAQIEAALARIRDEFRPKILEAREKDRLEALRKHPRARIKR